MTLTSAERRALARYLRLALGTLEYVAEKPLVKLVRQARRKLVRG